MRKGALNDMAEQLGCNKIALGHNKDDVVETFFMSLLYEGRLNCFAPVSYLDRKKLYSIRPLMYVPEWECRSFVNKSDIHIVKNPVLPTEIPNGRKPRSFWQSFPCGMIICRKRYSVPSSVPPEGLES